MKVFPDITSVAKEERENYPIRSFNGNIHVIYKPQDVDKAVVSNYCWF